MASPANGAPVVAILWVLMAADMAAFRGRCKLQACQAGARPCASPGGRHWFSPDPSGRD
jgi:hypothetical protein